MANSRNNRSANRVAEEELDSVSELASDTSDVKKPIIPREVDPSQYVYVRNGFQGCLNYKSHKTGERFRWNEYGDEQEMQLHELRSAKNTDKKFFINNWFMFDEEWILDYLGVRQYYKHAIPIDKFDSIYSLPPAKLKEKILSLSKGQQKSVAYRAQELIRTEVIDSRKTITALEEALGYDLIEK